MYDDAGRLDYFVNFNGTVTDYGFDNANRLTSLKNLNGTTPIATYAFTALDDNGNPLRVTTDGGINELAAPLPGAEGDLVYNAKRNRLTSAFGTISYTYDNEGQLATKQGGTHTFDGEHRLTGIGGTHGFGYDGLGNRLRVTRSGVTTFYIYDQNGNLLAEANWAKAITRYYIHGLGLAAMVTPAGSAYCYHFDQAGNTVAMTDSGKNVVNLYAYTPFGNLADSQETFAQPFLFAGRYGVMEETVGNSLYYYMRARYYDPDAGRFISEDPLGFGGGDLNLYAYVGGNPVVGVDPSGLCGSSALNWLQGGLDVVGLVPGVGEPFDIANAGISALRGNWAEAGLGALAAVPIVGWGGTAGKAGLKYSDDAAALIDLAKGAKRTGVSPADANSLLKWADEYNVRPARGPEIHPGRNFDQEHIHIGPVSHIQVNR